MMLGVARAVAAARAADAAPGRACTLDDQPGVCSEQEER